MFGTRCGLDIKTVRLVDLSNFLTTINSLLNKIFASRNNAPGALREQKLAAINSKVHLNITPLWELSPQQLITIWQEYTSSPTNSKSASLVDDPDFKLARGLNTLQVILVKCITLNENLTEDGQLLLEAVLNADENEVKKYLSRIDQAVIAALSRDSGYRSHQTSSLFERANYTLMDFSAMLLEEQVGNLQRRKALHNYLKEYKPVLSMVILVDLKPVESKSTHQMLDSLGGSRTERYLSDRDGLTAETPESDTTSTSSASSVRPTTSSPAVDSRRLVFGKVINK